MWLRDIAGTPCCRSPLSRTVCDLACADSERLICYRHEQSQDADLLTARPLHTCGRADK